MTTAFRAIAHDQNVRFPLFDHNPIWDKSINSKLVRVMNVVAQLAESFFKIMANISLRVLNSVHSVLFGLRKTETVTAADSLKTSTVSALKTNPEAVSSKLTRGSWMRTAGKVVLWTTLGIVIIGSIAWGANKMGYCPPVFSYFCGKIPDPIKAPAESRLSFEQEPPLVPFSIPSPAVVPPVMQAIVKIPEPSRVFSSKKLRTLNSLDAKVIKLTRFVMQDENVRNLTRFAMQATPVLALPVFSCKVMRTLARNSFGHPDEASKNRMRIWNLRNIALLSCGLAGWGSFVHGMINSSVPSKLPLLKLTLVSITAIDLIWVLGSFFIAKHGAGRWHEKVIHVMRKIYCEEPEPVIRFDVG